MSKERISTGFSGELEAVSLLKRNGYRIIVRNYRTKLGEIDIIASQGGTLCFVEVKARRSDRLGLGQEAITGLKQRHIARTALLYLKENHLFHRKARFDVVSIIYAQGIPKADLIKNAFELDAKYSY